MSPPLVPPPPNPPVCPYCESTLASVSIYTWLQVGLIVIAANCPSCCKVLHMQILPSASAPDPRAGN